MLMERCRLLATGNLGLPTTSKRHRPAKEPPRNTLNIWSVDPSPAAETSNLFRAGPSLVPR
jgi:hypothetical protein